MNVEKRNNKIYINNLVLREKSKTGLRHIYQNKHYVLKLDNIDESLGQQALEEWNNWERIKESPYKKYFVPILKLDAFDGIYYVIQKRIYFKYVSKKQYHKKFDILSEIEDYFGLCDIANNTRNYGMIGNRLKIWDYAF